MTITYQTSLSDIVDSETIVNNFISAMSTLRNDCTFPRVYCLRDEIAKPAISGAKIAGKAELVTAGQNVQSSYGTFHKALAELQESIRSSAVYKEKCELRDLIDKVTKRIDSLDDDIDDYERLMKNEEDEEKITEYRQLIRDIKRTKSSYVTKKENAIARLKKLGEDYSTVPTGEGTQEPDTTEQGMSYEERTEYNLKVGDKVTIDGATYEFLRVGKDENGATYTFYFNEGGQIVMIGPDGSMEETGIYHYDTYGAQLENQYPMNFYSSISTSEANASELGLPDQSKITHTEGNEEYQDVYVDYGAIQPGEVTQVTSSDELHEAVMDPQSNPIITMEATGLEDNKNIIQWFIEGDEDISANSGSSQITLIYDNSTGKYYPLDSCGVNPSV